MDNQAQERWSHIVDPLDSGSPVLMALLKLLLEKEVITEEEPLRLAGPSPRGKDPGSHVLPLVCSGEVV